MFILLSGLGLILTRGVLDNSEKKQSSETLLTMPEENATGTLMLSKLFIFFGCCFFVGLFLPTATAQ